MTKYLLHNATPLHTRDDLFNKHTEAGDHRVLRVVFVSEFLPLWFFLRLIRLDMLGLIPLEPRLLEESTGGERRACVLTNTCGMDTPGLGGAQRLPQAIFPIDHEGVFHGRRFF